MATRIQFRRGMASEWSDVNPVLGASEPGRESDSGRWKTGDGTTAWNDLPYQNLDLAAEVAYDGEVTGLGADVQAAIDALKALLDGQPSAPTQERHHVGPESVSQDATSWPGDAIDLTGEIATVSVRGRVASVGTVDREITVGLGNSGGEGNIYPTPLVVPAGSSVTFAFSYTKLWYGITSLVVLTDTSLNSGELNIEAYVDVVHLVMP